MINWSITNEFQGAFDSDNLVLLKLEDHHKIDYLEN